MKGLIKKDFITLGKKVKLINRLIIVIVNIAILISLKSAGIIVVAISGPLMIVTFPTTFIIDDDKFKWDKYALSLPVSKRVIVASRYLFFILLLTGCYIFNMIIGTVIFLLFHEYSFSQLLLIVFIGVAIAMVYLLLILPSLYKFGSKGGHVVMIILAVISSIVTFLQKKEYFSLQQILMLPKIFSVIVSIGAICIMGAISYLISLKFFKSNHS